MLYADVDFKNSTRPSPTGDATALYGVGFFSPTINRGLMARVNGDMSMMDSIEMQHDWMQAPND